MVQTLRELGHILKIDNCIATRDRKRHRVPLDGGLHSCLAPRSPGLSSCELFLLGAVVYHDPVESVMELVARLVCVAAIMKVTPGVFDRIRQSILSEKHKFKIVIILTTMFGY